MRRRQKKQTVDDTISVSSSLRDDASVLSTASSAISTPSATRAVSNKHQLLDSLQDEANKRIGDLYAYLTMLEESIRNQCNKEIEKLPFEIRNMNVKLFIEKYKGSVEEYYRVQRELEDQSNKVLRSAKIVEDDLKDVSNEKQDSGNIAAKSSPKEEITNDSAHHEQEPIIEQPPVSSVKAGKRKREAAYQTEAIADSATKRRNVRKKNAPKDDQKENEQNAIAPEANVEIVPKAKRGRGKKANEATENPTKPKGAHSTRSSVISLMENDLSEALDDEPVLRRSTRSSSRAASLAISSNVLSATSSPTFSHQPISLEPLPLDLTANSSPKLNPYLPTTPMKHKRQVNKKQQSTASVRRNPTRSASMRQSVLRESIVNNQEQLENSVVAFPLGDGRVVEFLGTGGKPRLSIIGGSHFEDDKEKSTVVAEDFEVAGFDVSKLGMQDRKELTSQVTKMQEQLDLLLKAIQD